MLSLKKKREKRREEKGRKKGERGEEGGENCLGLLIVSKIKPQDTVGSCLFFIFISKVLEKVFLT